MSRQDRTPRWRIPVGSRLFVVGDPLPPESPAWLGGPTSTFVDLVSDEGYPCHFGRQSLGVGDVFGTWLTAAEDATTLAAGVANFLDIATAYPTRRAVLACFVQPESPTWAHQHYERRFWNLLRALHASDPKPWPTDVPVDPDDAAWEFCFGGRSMFVFAAAPTHNRRKSRRLGESFVLLFQPRHVFDGIEGGTPAGGAARTIIRRRVKAWDDAPLHPAMGNYGDPNNREWPQYFIDDADPAPAADALSCPFMPDGSWRGVAGWIEDQAQRTPDAVALVDGAASVTYAEMLDRVAALGAQLVAAGAGRGDRVGVFVDRTHDSVLAMLACLWSGCAYVPIDPATPLARRSQLLDDAGIELALCSRQHLAAIPPAVRTVVLSDDVPRGPVTQRRAEVRADDLAYVIYTSGSTGTPKGVMVTHGQLAHAVFAQHALERPPPEAFLLPISLCFDAAGVGLYWTLTSGGLLVLPDHEQVRDPAVLRRMIARYGITHIDSTPALFDRVLGQDGAGLHSLRCVIVGGESCPSELLSRHRRLLPDCIFENNYGPTEASIWATAHVVTPTDPETYADRPVLTIGEPIHGAGVVLLAEDLGVAPGEEEAEIYITGDGVADGYIGHPAATAERFLPDPFSGRPGRRMYRTGDRAQRDRWGRLHFFGRLDSQVKLRGFRVELGEVEEALRSHPEVDEACAVVVDLGGADTLVGVIRACTGAASDASLSVHLMQRLPGHAVPRRYVRVEAFPRLVSGKLDRRRLMSLAQSTPVTCVPRLRDGLE